MGFQTFTLPNKDGNSNDLKLSKYKVEISHNLDVFDLVKNMEQSPEKSEKIWLLVFPSKD